MEKTIEIDGKKVTFKSTASTPMRYRALFQSDLLKDSEQLIDEVKQGGEFTDQALQTFMQLAYVMAKQADPDIPDSPEEWLDGFEMFSIYNVLPDLIQLWLGSKKTIESVMSESEDSKKNKIRKRKKKKRGR